MLVCLFACQKNLSGQQRIFTLSKSNTFVYRNDPYIFGFNKAQGPADFIVYKVNGSLEPIDSLIIKNATSDAQGQLQSTADSLHNFINIYLYRNDNSVSIVRISKQLKDYKKIEKVDVARLNNRAMFDEGAMYYKNTVYSISRHKDTSGIQFYLNCYSLTASDKNFDYQKKWQFPFERKNIQSARIIETQDAFVAIFVDVLMAGKHTQWILRINSNTGQLIKGTRLNAKDENTYYQYGSSFSDNNNKQILVAGIKHPVSTLTVTTPQTSTAITVFMALTDSFGQVIQKQNFKIPVKHTESGAVKTKTEYMLRPYSLSRSKDGKIILISDIYRSGNYKCFYFTGSINFEFTPNEEGYLLKKTEINNLPQLENYFITPDKNDLNGKICPGAEDQKEDLMFAVPILPVKVKYELDESGLPAWLLTKSSLSKKTINYSILAIEGKVFKLKKLEELKKEEDPAINLQGGNTFYISRQIQELEYIVTRYAW
jgi:hypothetical protein